MILSHGPERSRENGYRVLQIRPFRKIIMGHEYITDPGLVDWRRAAADMRLPMMPFVDGRHVESTGTDSYTCLNPATGRSLGDFPAGSSEDVARAVDAGNRSFHRGLWSAVSPKARQSVILELSDLIRKHAPTIAVIDTLQIGKPVSQSLSDAHWASRFFQYYAEAGDKIYDSAVPTDSRTIAILRRVPHGVVGAIIPWNFPIVNAALKLAPALMAGNSVVLKPSELSSGSALYLAELAQQAGLPDGVLNIVPGLGGTVGTALAIHQDVDMLTFTGSTTTGKHLAQLAGRSGLKPLMLECGGKSPHVVLPDVEDLDRIADTVVADIFRNQGQVCSAGSRLLVHENIASKLVARIKQHAEAIVPGDPLDADCTFGPLASEAQLKRVLSYIERGKKEGARLIHGGKKCRKNSDGFYLQPTVFTDVDERSCLATDEIFGPILSITIFRDGAEAVRLANATPYGLAATVWTRDVGLGEAMARRIVAGVVTVRDDRSPGTGGGMALASEPAKLSGYGVQGGVHGTYPYTRLKAVQHLLAGHGFREAAGC